MNTLEPEDHAEMQRRMALAAGDADETVEPERKRLPSPENAEEWFRARKFQMILRAGGRRRNYLAELVKDEHAASPSARDFNRAELAFVEAGLEALRFWKRHAATADAAMELLRDVSSVGDDFDVSAVAERATEILGRDEQAGR